MEKMKNWATIAVFALLIFGLVIAHVIIPDATHSLSERRELSKFPAITADSVFSGDWGTDFEEYLLDHFPGRDGFRTVKAILRYKLLAQKDNNKVFLVGDGIFKMEYPLNENQVVYAAQKFNWIYEKYLQGMRVFYSVIPDKNYFAAAQNGYPALDYDRLYQLMNDNVQNMTYADIRDCLTLSDFYRTDTHWRQECLGKVMEVLAKTMGFSDLLLSMDSFEQHKLSPFKGVYYGQAAMPLKADDLVYLTHSLMANAQTSVQMQEGFPIYATDKFEGMDGYDVFLSGAQSFVEITNPDALTDKELIIFRDSFGSSIAPLFVPYYAKVTLVDIRYTPSSMLDKNIEFADQDVLFLYSTLVLNNGMVLK
ncbi:MAG: hypothetical protein IKD06_06015 [Clostridia bacterium]|nr:hypothetical protein [Clostridia bacterium]